MRAVGLDLGEPCGGAPVARVVLAHALVERLGGVELPGAAQRVALRQPLPEHHIAHPEILGAHRAVVRPLLHRLLEQRERVLAAAFGVLLARFVDDTRAGARREYQ